MSEVNTELKDAPHTKRGFSTKEAGSFLGVAAATLETWRVSGKGPKFVRVNRRVIYLREDLNCWLEKHRYASTSEYAVGKNQ